MSNTEALGALEALKRKNAAEAAEYRRMMEEAKAVKAAEEQKAIAGQAYDKGKIDAENSLARMLYEQVYAPQGATGSVATDATNNWMSDNMPVPSTPPQGLDVTGLSYEAARKAGLVR